MRRPVWLGAGMVIGAGATLWAEQRVRRRVRRTVERLSPDRVAMGARTSVVRLGARVRDAVDAGRVERDRREDELWTELTVARPERDRVGPPPGGRRGHR